MTNVQLIFRRFPGHCLFMTMMGAILLVAVVPEGLFESPSPAYAETQSASGDISNAPGEASNARGELLKIPGAGKPAEQMFSVMQKQLRSYQKKLEDSERRLQEFQREHGIIVLEKQMDHLLQQRKSLDDALMEAENRLQGFRERLAWVREQIAQIPAQVPLSHVDREKALIGGAKNDLLKLKLQEQDLLNKYNENNPHVQVLRREMALIEQFIKEQEDDFDRSETTGKNPLYAEMEMQLFHTQADFISAEAQKKVIKQQIVEVDNELKRLRNLRPELDELRRRVVADEKNYLNYLTRVGTTPPQDYEIQVGDQLDVKFFFNPELNEAVLVRPDGRISLQLVGELSVVGNTVEQIRTILIENYSSQLKNPEIAVLLRSSNVPGEVLSSPAGTEVFGGIDGN